MKPLLLSLMLLAVLQSNGQYVEPVREPDRYWKVIEYTKNGVKVQEAWLGLNDVSNKSTDPKDIVTDVQRQGKIQVRTVIKVILRVF